MSRFRRLTTSSIRAGERNAISSLLTLELVCTSPISENVELMSPASDFPFPSSFTSTDAVRV